MLKSTKAHEKEITKGQFKIRMGGRVPKGAVNLAYSYVTPLTPDENVQIADTSGFILENVAANKISDLELWPDATYLLRNLSGKSDIYSQTFLITNIFKDETPLYFSHRLSHLHYDATGPDAYGFYQGKSIIIINRDGQKIGDNDKKVHILLRPTASLNLYNVDIYTSFQTKPGEEYKAVYNAVYFDESGEQSVQTGFSERLNAQPAFSPRTNIEEVTKPELNGEPIYYRAQNADFGYSQIYVSNKPLRDKRTPVTFRYRIRCDVTTETGLETIYSPWLGADVLNAESLTVEDTEYTNGFKRLSTQSGEEIVKQYLFGTGKETWLDLYPCEYSVESSLVDVEVGIITNGNEPVVARTSLPTGNIDLPLDYRISFEQPKVEFQLRMVLVNKTTGDRHIGLVTETYSMTKNDGARDIKNLNYAEWDYPLDYTADNYELAVEVTSPTSPATFSLWDKVNEMYVQSPVPCTTFDGTTDIVVRVETNQERKVFTQKYSVRPTDSAQIRVLRPIAKGSKQNWFLRIQNGRFYRSYIDENNLPQGYGYFLPEYYNQAFDDTYGTPYRAVVKEKPQVVDTNQIKLLYTPLFIHVDKLTNTPDNITVRVNEREMVVKNWDAAEGIVELDGAVRESDRIEVDYFYQENCYEYRGFYDEDQSRFWYLDLNPGKGHFSTQYDKEADEIKDLPSFGLINKTVYLYMKPAGNMTNIVQVLAERVTPNSIHQYTLEHQALRIFTPRVYLRYADTDVPHVDDALAGETSWEIVNEGYLYQTIQINNPQHMIDDHYAIDYSYTSDRYRFINGTFQKAVLFHTFEEINESNTILLGKIQVRPNSARDGIQLTDTRTRGGGLLTSIGESIMNEIAPESTSYWDIGYWDGSPYPENGVILVKLPRHVLKEYGGKLTKEEVEAAVEKHLAYGVFYIVEYLEEPNALIEIPKDLVVEIVELPDDLYLDLPTPTFKLITEG